MVRSRHRALKLLIIIIIIIIITMITLSTTKDVITRLPATTVSLDTTRNKRRTQEKKRGERTWRGNKVDMKRKKERECSTHIIGKRICSVEVLLRYRLVCIERRTSVHWMVLSRASLRSYAASLSLSPSHSDALFLSRRLSHTLHRSIPVISCVSFVQGQVHRTHMS